MIGAPFGQVILCTPRDDCTLMFNASLTTDRVLLPGRLRGSMLTDVAGEHIRWLSCRHILTHSRGGRPGVSRPARCSGAVRKKPSSDRFGPPMERVDVERETDDHSDTRGILALEPTEFERRAPPTALFTMDSSWCRQGGEEEDRRLVHKDVGGNCEHACGETEEVVQL